MDIYRKFTPIASSVVGSGYTFPADMRTLVIANNAGGVNVDLFTYGPTGGTQSNRIRVGFGTYFLPFQLWGISSGSSPSLNYLIGY